MVSPKMIQNYILELILEIKLYQIVPPLIDAIPFNRTKKKNY